MIFRSMIRYSVIIILCYIAFAIQMQYRVASFLLGILMALLSLATLSLYVIYFLRDITVNIDKRHPLIRIERAAGYLVRLFIYYSIFVYANGVLDTNIPKLYKTKILEIPRGEILLDVSLPVSWIDLRSWEKPDKTKRILMKTAEIGKFWAGEDVVISVHQGFFRVPWISKIRHDEEKYYQEILEQLPYASEVRKKLIYTYLNNSQLDKVVTETLTYLNYYPNDYDLTKSIAAELGQRRYHKGATDLLEHFWGKLEEYHFYNLFGWELTKAGELQRGIEILESSIEMDPDHFWAYYHLGYAYKKAGRFDRSMAMFRKVLEIRPVFPEIEQQIRLLEEKIM
jgi:hypothetical protein